MPGPRVDGRVAGVTADAWLVGGASEIAAVFCGLVLRAACWPSLLQQLTATANQEVVAINAALGVKKKNSRKQL